MNQSSLSSLSRFTTNSIHKLSFWTKFSQFKQFSNLIMYMTIYNHYLRRHTILWLFDLIRYEKTAKPWMVNRVSTDLQTCLPDRTFWSKQNYQTIMKWVSIKKYLELPRFFSLLLWAMACHDSKWSKLVYPTPCSISPINGHVHSISPHLS